jgi:hypothetical protein
VKKFYRNTSHENSTVPFAFAHFCGIFGFGGACLALLGAPGVRARGRRSEERVAAGDGELGYIIEIAGSQCSSRAACVCVVVCARTRERETYSAPQSTAASAAGIQATFICGGFCG